MGQITFTPLQQQIFNEFSKTKLSKQFYFTGLQRTEVKDFVDLYFLLQKYTLPKMLVPLDLTELKSFYTDLAEKLGKKVVKP